MIAVDAIDGCRQPLGRIEPVELAAGRDEMGVGEDDEFHRAMAKSGWLGSGAG